MVDRPNDGWMETPSTRRGLKNRAMLQHVVRGRKGSPPSGNQPVLEAFSPNGPFSQF
jgi:hypothetical protein